ncbi:MAG: 2-C-methyl-D-erythritol 2,4-cyclodiphosphate synthase [Muribaculaceae bacterium]|nr:2-C-methyl-D-erythritol 2,4-cyclodiphosphate synthase [Muribaculaceae bacterium]
MTSQDIFPFRVGSGYDVHRLVEGRELWLCGLRLDHTHGLLGHSDADVAIHALCDALLGAAALRDIGYHFPDTDPAFNGADSKRLLAAVRDLLAGEGWSIGNVDVTVMAEAPKLKPHIEDMRRCLAEVMGIPAGCVSVKATTTEGLGFTGRREGIAAQATALIFRTPQDSKS